MQTLIKGLKSKDVNTRLKWIGMLLGIFISGAVFGFVYETIFYVFNDHMILKRGTTFLPIIQLYGWGGLMIFLVTWDIRQKPWMVALVSGVACGLLELVTGYLLFHLGNGYRGWDYNTEIWNWGNIGGYVCFRSVAVFTLSGLLLVYVIMPLLQALIEKVGVKRFVMVMSVVTAIALVDIVYNDMIADNFGLMNARTFYESLGWPYRPV